MSQGWTTVALQRPKQRIHTGNVVRGSACETRAGSVTDQVVVLRVERAVQIGGVPVSRVVGDERILKVGSGTAIGDSAATGEVRGYRAAVAGICAAVTGYCSVGQSKTACICVKAATLRAGPVPAHCAVHQHNRANTGDSAADVGDVSAYCAARQADRAAVLIIDATATAAGASPVSADRAVCQSDRATSVINAAAKAVSEVAAHPAVV